MSNQEETLQALEQILRGREIGMSELRNYAEQTARQAVSTEAVANRLQEQQQACHNHIRELDSIRGSLNSLSSQVSLLGERVGKVLDKEGNKIKWWSIWIPFLVALLTVIGGVYSLKTGQKNIIFDQKAQTSQEMAILAENEKAIIAILQEIRKK